MNEVISLLRRGARIEVDCHPQHEETFNEAYDAARDEVEAMHDHAQMVHVRATLDGLREEEAHLRERLERSIEDRTAHEEAYAHDLMRKRSEVRAEAERTGAGWVFDEHEKMEAAGWSREEVQWHRQRRAAEMALAGDTDGALHLMQALDSPMQETAAELPQVTVRRAAFEILSAYLTRWQRLPSSGEVNPHHSRTNKNKWRRRTRAVATILLWWDADAKKLVRRPGWEGADATELFGKVAEQPGESLTGDTPSNTIEGYFRDNLGDDFPTGGDMEGWFGLARKWAQDVPEKLFDAK